jgi:hypothetical protein
MIKHTVGELLEDKVQLDIEGIDRLYLNAYQPRMQTGGGVVGFFRAHRGAVVAPTTLMAPMSQAFVAAIEQFAKTEGVAIVHFARGQRKKDRALRTETTINDSRDFAIGRRLHNLPALRAIGFAANRRVLEVERVSQDCQLGEALFDQVNQP